MKTIGIIFAMKEEKDELLEYVKVHEEKNIFDLKFTIGNINNTKCILVESGVGKVNAARCTQVLIDNFEIDYIFNIGVAGSISKDVNICDIVIGEKLVQHDFDITAFNHEKGYIPKVGVYVNSDEYLLKMAKSINEPNTHIGVIASGDIFCTDINMSKNINKEFNALCVEMEGASIAQVCYLCNIPFLVIRSISDSINGENKIDYDEFLSSSSKKIAEFLNKMIIKMEG